MVHFSACLAAAAATTLAAAAATALAAASSVILVMVREVEELDGRPGGRPRFGAATPDAEKEDAFAGDLDPVVSIGLEADGLVSLAADVAGCEAEVASDVFTFDKVFCEEAGAPTDAAAGAGAAAAAAVAADAVPVDARNVAAGAGARADAKAVASGADCAPAAAEGALTAGALTGGAPLAIAMALASAAGGAVDDTPCSKLHVLNGEIDAGASAGVLPGI